MMDNVGAIGKIRRRRVAAKVTLEKNEFQKHEDEIETKCTYHSAQDKNSQVNINNNSLPNVFSKYPTTADATQTTGPSQNKCLSDEKQLNEQYSELGSSKDAKTHSSPSLSSKKQSLLLTEHIPAANQGPTSANDNPSTIDNHSLVETVILDYDPPPDGGWGWVVVAACFIHLFFIVGIGTTQGVFIPHWEVTFEVNTSQSSWIGSLLTSMYFLSSPIVSGLINVYDCRRVAFCGLVLSSVAFFIASFSESIFTMIVLYSLIGGFGFGMVYLPGMVMTGYYFDKHRGLAQGIALCGSGVGTMGVAPMLEVLIRQLGWEMCLRIFAGMVLTSSLAALAFRPLHRPRVVEKWKYYEVDENDDNDNDDDADDAARKHLKEISLDESVFNDMVYDTAVDDDLLFYKRMSRGKSMEKLPQSRSMYGAETRTTGTTQHSSKVLAKRVVVSRDITPGNTWSHVDVMLPLSKDDILYDGNLDRIYGSQSGTPSRHAAHPATTDAEHGSSVDSKLGHLSMPGKTKSIVRATTPQQNEAKKHWGAAFVGIFDVKLFRSPVFMVYCASCTISLFGMYSILFHIKQAFEKITHDAGTDGSSPNGALLLTAYGVVQIVGRFATGLIADHPRVDILLFSCVALFVVSVSTLFLPHIPGEHPALFFVFICVFSLSLAVIITLRSKMIIQLVGIENLTKGFGLLNFVQGVSVMSGPPVTGALFDATHNYEATFYMSAGFLCMGWVLCLVLVIMVRREKEKLMQQTTQVLPSEAKS